MLDFTSLPTRRKAYGGANGNKLSIIYQGELWMLKLPSCTIQLFLQKNPEFCNKNPAFLQDLPCFSMLFRAIS